MPFGGIAGHTELLMRLSQELSRRPAHAYLFSGPRGVGKALSARALAHSILCERATGAGFCCRPERCPARAGGEDEGRARGAAARPLCDCCAACVQVALGVHPDLTCVALAPGRSEVLIEQVRGLIAALAVRPARGAVKVAIIDDAETLGIPAQNALLKTLEEPPGHAVIFMVAQSERALLDTVRSRMRPVRFRALSPEEIETVLGARPGLDPARAGALARLARGSLGRALALADGAEPPMVELLGALGRAGRLGFVEAERLAQSWFSDRDEAAENFELIARLIEEILCLKLLGTRPVAASPEAVRLMEEMASRLDVETLLSSLGAALQAASAVEAMANSRLQAERFWMSVGRGENGSERGNRSV